MSILIFSTNGTYTTKADLATANSAADVAGKTVVITSGYTISVDTTLRSDCTWKIEKGGLLTIASGKTLTFQSQPQIPDGVHAFTGSGAVAGLKEARPEWFGGSADGVTGSAAAMRNAVASLTNGGVLKLNPGSYYMDSIDPTPISTDEYVTVAIPSNVVVQGAGRNATSLKLSTSLTSPGRLSFIGTRSGASGQIIRDLNFDYNGKVLSVAFSSYNAIRAVGGKILMERLNIENAPGRNMIVTTTDATIRDVVIHNGSKNVSGNTVADDASFIYLNGANNIVEDSYFYNDSAPVTNCGGVEVHATNTLVRNNRFVNLYPAMYVGIQDYATIAYNNQIEGNKFDSNYGAVSIVDRNIGLKISHNYFKSNKGGGHNTIMTPRDDTTGVTSAGVQDHVMIDSNTFDGEDTIAMAGLQNSSIVSNRFKSCTLPVNIQGSTTTCKNVIVSNNTFIDPPSYAPSVIGQVQLDGSTSASWSAVYQDVLIHDNLFSSARSGAAPTNQYALVAGGNAAYTTQTNCLSYANEVVNLQGEFAGTAALSFAEWQDWIPTLTRLSAYSVAKFSKVGKKVFYRFTAEGKNVTGAGAIQFTLPINLASTTSQLVSVAVNDGTNWITTTATLGAPNTVSIYKTAALASWAGSETNITIRIDGYYRID